MKVKDLIELLNSYNLEDQVIVRLELTEDWGVYDSSINDTYDFPINETYNLSNTVVLEIIERDKEVR